MSIPQSSADDPTAIIVDILEGYSGWTIETPTVLRWWDRPQSERGPGQGQPAEIYVYQEPTQTHERFSADADNVTETGSVTVFVYSLSESETQQFKTDVKQLLEEYMSDNYTNINLHTIEPEESNDYRVEHLTQTTDHYVESYTLGYRNFRESGL